MRLIRYPHSTLHSPLTTSGGDEDELCYLVFIKTPIEEIIK